MSLEHPNRDSGSDRDRDLPVASRSACQGPESLSENQPSRLQQHHTKRRDPRPGLSLPRDNATAPSDSESARAAGPKVSESVNHDWHTGTSAANHGRRRRKLLIIIFTGRTVTFLPLPGPGPPPAR
jgi:hypothetical protein